MSESGPRPAVRSELEKVVDLVNYVFRTSEGLAPTMGEEFPILFREENLDNIRIVSDGEVPVASLGLYKTVLEIYGALIPVAFVGAVATHPEHRGRGLAGLLFRDAEEKLKAEGVNLLFVSGDRGLYHRNDCSYGGPYIRFELQSGEAKPREFLRELDATISDFSESDLDAVRLLYMGETVRFHRSYDDFATLYRGAVHSWGGRSHRCFLLKRGDSPAAYVVLRIREGTGEIVEYAGDRSLVAAAFLNSIALYGLQSVRVLVPPSDGLLIHLLAGEGIPFLQSVPPHTLKVLNFPSLMRNLLPYLRQLTGDSRLAGFFFDERDSLRVLSYGKETFSTDDLKIVNSLLFIPEFAAKIVPSADEKLIGFLQSIFPIPLPSLDNLNYI